MGVDSHSNGIYVLGKLIIDFQTWFEKIESILFMNMLIMKHIHTFLLPFIVNKHPCL